MSWALSAAAFLTAALSGIAGLGGGTILIGVLYAVGMAPVEAVLVAGAFVHGCPGIALSLLLIAAYSRPLPVRFPSNRTSSSKSLLAGPRRGSLPLAMSVMGQKPT